MNIHNNNIFVYVNVCDFHLRERLAQLQAGRPKKLSLLGHLFLSMTHVFCDKKTGGACLYMPQDGHWLAGFEVIPPPKLVFPRQKKENFNKGCAHTFEINLKSTKNLLFWLFLSGSAVTPISTLANNNSTSDPAHQKVENFRPKLCFFSIFRRNFWHDFVTPFSTFANIKGCLPTKSTTPD